MKNPKHEIRNPKQIQNSNVSNSKHSAFRFFGFGYWDLFRISNFGFRVYRQGGQIVLIAVIFFLIISTTVAFGVLNPVLRQVQQADDFARTRASLYASQSVNEDAIYRLMSGKQFVSPSTISLNGYTAQASSTSVAGGFQINSSGNALGLVRNIQTHLTLGSGASFNYGVQVGEGGFDGNNNSIIDGNLFSNGPVTGTTKIQGDVISAGPSGTVSGITATSSVYAHTISNATIYKDAFYQSISGSTVGGVSHPGSVDQATSSMPISDSEITKLESDAAAGGITSCDDGHHISGTVGPRKFACDVDINGDLTLLGPVWIAGNITNSNNVKVSVDDSLAGKTVAIISDNQADSVHSGKITQKNNMEFVGAGANSFVTLISMNDAEETNSSNNISAIDTGNNISGQVLLYAPHGQITIGNNTILKEVTGYKLSLGNGVEIRYETGLANILFTSGPSGGYVFDKWREVQ